MHIDTLTLTVWWLIIQPLVLVLIADLAMIIWLTRKPASSTKPTLAGSHASTNIPPELYIVPNQPTLQPSSNPGGATDSTYQNDNIKRIEVTYA